MIHGSFYDSAPDHRYAFNIVRVFGRRLLSGNNNVILSQWSRRSFNYSVWRQLNKWLFVRFPFMASQCSFGHVGSINNYSSIAVLMCHSDRAQITAEFNPSSSLQIHRAQDDIFQSVTFSKCRVHTVSANRRCNIDLPICPLLSSG